MTKKVYTPVQIDRMLARARKVVHTLSRKPEIRRIAEQAGYTQEEHDLGWALLLELMGYRPPQAAPAPPPNAEYDAAVAKLDTWDRPHFERTLAALERFHPDQAAYIFNNLRAGKGAESVGAVNTYVTRVVALRDGTDPAREATRAADRAAADVLAARNIFNAETEAYLRGLLTTAVAAAGASPAPEPPAEDEDPAYQSKLAELDRWLTDWRRTLRSVITRRDYLIQLGLASRRTSANEDDDDKDPEDT